jgi:hypothetical protein
MEQLPNKLQQSSPASLPAIECNEISLYSGELTPKVVIDNVSKIKKAFPTLPTGFYDILSDRIKDKGFCDERLTDAVNHVIDNCPYPTPTIANFISYDKTVKFKTWNDMTRDDLWNAYVAVKFPDRPLVVWIHKNDIAQFNLKQYEVK